MPERLAAPTKDRLTIQGDTAETLGGLIEGAFTEADAVLALGAALYVAHPAGEGSVVFARQFLARGWRLHQTLVWVKDRLILGHSDYRYRHEPILFGYKPAASGRRGRGGTGWYGPNNCSSVFEVPSPKRQDEHPTSKPVELVTAMLKNSSRTGEVVLDPFLGSGSTPDRGRDLRPALLRPGAGPALRGRGGATLGGVHGQDG